MQRTNKRGNCFATAMKSKNARPLTRNARMRKAILLVVRQTEQQIKIFTVMSVQTDIVTDTTQH